MKHSKRARNPDLTVGLLNPKGVLQRAKEERNSLVQVAMSMEALVKNRLEHWMKEISTAERDDEVEKVPIAEDTDKTDEPNAAKKDGDRWDQLSEVKSMIDEALIESDKSRDSQVAKMTENMSIDAMKLFSVEVQHGTVQSIVSLAIYSVAGNLLHKKLAADHMQKTATKAVVHLSMIRAVADALLKKDNLLASISTFASNYVEKSQLASRKRKKFSGLRSICEGYLHHQQRLTPRTMNTWSPGTRIKGALVLVSRSLRIRVCLVAIFMMTCGA